jgi:hypothetical protein
MLQRLWVKSCGPCRTALLGLLMLSFAHPIVHFPRFSVFLVVLMAMILKNDCFWIGPDGIKILQQKTEGL